MNHAVSTGGRGNLHEIDSIYLRSIPKSNTSTYMYVDDLFQPEPWKGRVEAAKIWRGRNQSHLQMSKIESRTISVHFYAQFQKCSHKTFVRTIVRTIVRTKNVIHLPDLTLRLWNTFMRWNIRQCNLDTLIFPMEICFLYEIIFCFQRKRLPFYFIFLKF